MTAFQTSRTIAAAPAAVFAAISDPARLARWWGPDGFTNTFRVFEFVAGGRWQFTMHGPDGRDYANDSSFVEILPAAKVVVRHLSPPEFVLSIELTPAPAGTLVHWVQDFADAAVAEAVRAIVVPANEQNLDRLTREVRTPA